MTFILVSSFSNRDLSFSVEDYTKLLEAEISLMEKPEMIGYLIELIEKRRMPLDLTKWIQTSITAEKRCCLRLRYRSFFQTSALAYGYDGHELCFIENKFMSFLVVHS